MLTSWTGNPSTATSLRMPSAKTSTLPVTPTADKAVGVLAANGMIYEGLVNGIIYHQQDGEDEGRGTSTTAPTTSH